MAASAAPKAKSHDLARRTPVRIKLREIVAGMGVAKHVEAVLLPGGCLVELVRADGTPVWIPVAACKELEPVSPSAPSEQ